MNIPNPKSLIERYTATRALEKMGLGQVLNSIEELQREIQGIRSGLLHFDTPEWKWLVSEFLPGEHIRLAIARSQIPPDDAGKQAIAQGQINEILHLQEITGDVTRSLKLLEDQLAIHKKTEAKLRQRSKTNG